jgi:hypothetical protein
MHVVFMYAIFAITQFATRNMLRSVKGSPYSDPFGALCRFLMWMLFFSALCQTLILMFNSLTPEADVK